MILFLDKVVSFLNSIYQGHRTKALGYRVGNQASKHSFIYLVSLGTNCPNSGIPNLGNWESHIGDDIVTYFFGYPQKKHVSYRLSRMPFGQLMAEFSNSPTGGGWIHGLVKL